MTGPKPSLWFFLALGLACGVAGGGMVLVTLAVFIK
jgi:hypothetical protein